MSKNLDKHTIHFQRFITENSLFTTKDKLLVAASGGRDSMALIFLLKALHFKFEIAHCNFQLRGKESDEDEAFLEEFCRKNALKFHSIKFETKEYCSKNGFSTQLGARTLRYNWFEELTKENKFDYLLTGHHKGDQLETILYNFTKGSGLKGLRGILPKKNSIVRPLLCFTRNEINDIIDQNNLNFREDSSNTSIKYARNRIRKNIVPELEKINPALSRDIQDFSNRINELESIEANYIKKALNKIVKKDHIGSFININDLINSEIKKTLLFHFLKKYDWNKTGYQTNIWKAILSQSQGILASSKTQQLILFNNKLRVITIEEDQTILLQKWKRILKVGAVKYNCQPIPASKIALNSNQQEFIDNDLVKFPITIRPTESKDYFYPIGLNKKKKVSKFLREQKLSETERNQVYVMQDATQKIIWVIGYRLDHRFSVTRNTKKAIKFKQKK